MRFTGDDRRLDSNGRDVNGRSVAFVSPRGVGQNDFTFDFGFRRIPPPPAPPPPPPKPPVTPPPESGPLVLIKHVLRRTQSTVEYLVIARNGGPNTVTDVRVCDPLPAGLHLVSATRSGRRVTGRQVCWHLASLSSGEERTLRVTARARAGTLTGTTVNCVDARAIGTPPAPNVPGKHIGPVRACATVHAAVRPPPPTVTG